MDTLYYFWPERGRLGTQQDDLKVWPAYRAAAEAAGFVLDVVTVDDIDVLSDPENASRVLVRGQAVDPGRAAFHNKLYTWPLFAADAWRSLATFAAITQAGYCTLIPQNLNIVTNDKGTTLSYLRCVDDGWVPTLTVPTRDIRSMRAQLPDLGIDYPLIVKPANWGAGMGVTRAVDEAGLLTTLRLASAAELTMVVQPDLSDTPEFADVRVFCVDREPIGAMRRTPARAGEVANLTLGARSEMIEVPAELHKRASAIARYLDVPWAGVDFLHHRGRYLLSEVEVDACLGPVLLHLPGIEDILNARFQAYRSDFERWQRGGVDD